MPNRQALVKPRELRLNRIPEPISTRSRLSPDEIEHLKDLGIPEELWEQFTSDLKALVCNILDAEYPLPDLILLDLKLPKACI